MKKRCRGGDDSDDDGDGLSTVKCVLKQDGPIDESPLSLDGATIELLDRSTSMSYFCDSFEMFDNLGKPECSRSYWHVLKYYGKCNLTEVDALCDDPPMDQDGCF